MDKPFSTLPRPRCSRCDCRLNHDSARRGFELCWACSKGKHEGTKKFDPHNTGGCPDHGWSYMSDQAAKRPRCTKCQQEKYLQSL